ncbi:hypothetical protein LFE_0860 [Leptospirillum ferrooxidans C2-3]|uniref:Uncharacterized protein n=1 Tax=Leptospirillum ferrooxidans (strain C2-3) TaxID=1162668 RepID=I0IMS0_LEPFC|nr:hypothetical protein LFE_0860 [Leptospirillum ferrooxidans C2-3]
MGSTDDRLRFAPSLIPNKHVSIKATDGQKKIENGSLKYSRNARITPIVINPPPSEIISVLGARIKPSNTTNIPKRINVQVIFLNAP